MSPVETGLALLLAITTALGDGLKAYKEKRYDDAKKQLTVVVKKAETGGEHWQSARFYRAKTFLALKDKENAKKDLLELLKWPGKKDIRKDALKDYLALDGKKTDFLPKDDPKKVLLKYLDLANKGDYDGGLKLVTGTMAKNVENTKKVQQRQGNRGIGRNVNRKIIKTVVGEDDEFGKAWVITQPNWGINREGMTYYMHYEFVLFPKKGVWKLSSTWYETKFKDEVKFEDGEVRRGKENVGFNQSKNQHDLTLLWLTLSRYSVDNDGSFPKALKDIQNDDYLDDAKTYLWTHPFSGEETLAFLYRSGLKADVANAATTLLMAAPDAYDGKRSVLYADGQVKLIDEADFKRQSKAQGWKVPVPERAFAGSDEVKKKAEAFIKDLAAADFKTRRAAKKGLKELGKSIVPVLEKHLKSKDPEVRESVKTLIENM